MRPRILAACLLALSLLAGCDSATGPTGLNGSYNLYAVNGNRPPGMVLAPTAPGGGMQVVDASLVLAAPDEVTVRLVTRALNAQGVPGSIAEEVFTGTYVATGGSSLDLGTLQSERQARGYAAVISPREVVVTLHVFVPSYLGYGTYPIQLFFRR